MYSESCQTSRIECFAKIVNDFSAFTIFAKCSIFDIWLGSECAFGVNVVAVVNYPQFLKLSILTRKRTGENFFHINLWHKEAATRGVL